jgi:hypothetical protein
MLPPFISFPEKTGFVNTSGLTLRVSAFTFPRLKFAKTLSLSQNSVGFEKASIEKFLTTKVHKGAEGRNKALLYAYFVGLIRLCG